MIDYKKVRGYNYRKRLPQVLRISVIAGMRLVLVWIL
jgi:hypothetical protein